MDACFIDVTVEFLDVAFHNILYYASVYPRSIFEPRKKYSVVVHHSIHPEVNQYLDLCLKSIAECLKNCHLYRIEFAITDGGDKTLAKFVFDIHRNENFDQSEDAYLVQCEQNLRAFCLQLSYLSDKLPEITADCSFSILIHTNESGAVALTTNADLEDFPLVEVQGKPEEKSSILPLRRFSIRNCNFDTYIEL